MTTKSESFINSWPGQPKHRLTLFYVANDVVQYARRKKVNDLYANLKGAIADIVPLLREDSIIQSVQRVLTVSRNDY